ncbi:MAG: hypothetical protein F4213_17120 [Boseongicola sp. SB0677_bin_26]|nr:hypothetical protein [Boseongicola sp. SB0677_bin_26]
MTLASYMSRLGFAVERAYFVAVIWKLAAFLAFLLAFWTTMAGFLGQPPVSMPAAQERDAANEAVAVVKAIAEVLPGAGPDHLSTNLFADALRPFQGPEARFSVSHDLGLGGFEDVLVLTPWGWEITVGVGLTPDMRDDTWTDSWIRVAGLSSRACALLASAFVDDPAVAVPFTGDRPHVHGNAIQRGCDGNHDHSVTLAFRQR